MDPTSYETHAGPGRRFAAGTTRGDHLLGAFGFLAHAFFFAALTSGLCLARPVAAAWVFWPSLAASLALLGLRAWQVGASTTAESVRAVRNAWRR